MLNANTPSGMRNGSHVPVLYGPDRDNAPHKFRYPPDAMQPDFFSSFRDDKESQQQLTSWSSTTRETFTKQPAELAKESKTKASETARFNKEIHFALDRADGRDPAKRFTTVIQRDYVAHELPDTTDHVCHENKYPPVFRDETHLITPSKSLYGLSFTDSPSVVREPATSRLSARLRRSRLRADSIVLGADSHDGDNLLGKADPDRSISVTKRDFSDAVAKGIGPRHDLQLAKQVRDRDKKPSTVLECPDGEVGNGLSTVQTDYRVPRMDEFEKPDMAFKAELVATHVSLATTAEDARQNEQQNENKVKSQYQANYVPHKVQAVDKSAGRVSRAVLFCEEEDRNEAGGKARSGTPAPAASTTKASFIAHKVQRHVPIHCRDISSVFAGLNLDPSESARRKVQSVSQSDYTEHDWTSPRFGSATPGRRIVPNTRSHVLVPEDDTPTSASRLSESHAQFTSLGASSASQDFVTARNLSRAQLKSACASHFALGNELGDDGQPKLATETTMSAHHAASARMVDSLLASTKGMQVDIGLRRKPVKPDHSFATSLRNTVAWDDGNNTDDARDAAMGRKFDATSTSRATYLDPPKSVLASGSHSRFVTGSHVDHITPMAGSGGGNGEGEWVSTTQRVHVPPSRALAMAMAQAVVSGRPF